MTKSSFFQVPILLPWQNFSAVSIKFAPRLRLGLLLDEVAQYLWQGLAPCKELINLILCQFSCFSYFDGHQDFLFSMMEIVDGKYLHTSNRLHPTFGLLWIYNFLNLSVSKDILYPCGTCALFHILPFYNCHRIQLDSWQGFYFIWFQLEFPVWQRSIYMLLGLLMVSGKWRGKLFWILKPDLVMGLLVIHYIYDPFSGATVVICNWNDFEFVIKWSC